MPKLGTCCNSSERPHLLLFCFLKKTSRRSVGGKWETQPRFPSGPRPRLFHNQTIPLTLDKTDSRSATLGMTKLGAVTFIRGPSDRMDRKKQQVPPLRFASVGMTILSKN